MAYLNQDGLSHYHGKLKDIAHNVIASEFSDSVSYSVGEYVFYNNRLYKFIITHSAGAWSANDVVSVDVGSEFRSINGETKIVNKIKEMDIRLCD